jgi:hypothetical protein
MTSTPLQVHRAAANEWVELAGPEAEERGGPHPLEVTVQPDVDGCLAFGLSKYGSANSQ